MRLFAESGTDDATHAIFPVGPLQGVANPKAAARLGPMLSVAAICVGASLGALARWGLGLWLSPGALIPLGTLAANLIGGYLVGVCVAVFQALPQLDPVWRLALVTGFLGALTTFSSFSAEVIDLLGQQRYALALSTACLHLFGSLALTVAGLRSAAFLLAQRA